jgi:hypothetical protein
MFSDLVINYIQYKINNFSKFKLEDKLKFYELASKINDTEIIGITKDMLNLIIYQKDNIHVKKFLSCYMIIQHSKVLISEDTELEQKILKLCVKIIKLVNKIKDCDNLQDYIVYKKILNLFYTKYIELFDIWKENDKLKILNDLVGIYFELENDKVKKYDNIDDENNKQFVISIEREQTHILSKIKQIGGEEGMTYFNNIKSEIDNYKEEIDKLYTNIQENLHDAYWHHIQFELNKNPPNNIVIVHLLTELKDMLLSCNKNIKEDLDEKIDIEFIKDMISHNVIDNKYIYNMCLYIIGYIEEFQSRVHDEETKVWKKSVLEKFEGGTIRNEEFFPLFFRAVFEKIQIILYEIDIFKYITQNM